MGASLSPRRRRLLLAGRRPGRRPGDNDLSSAPGVVTMASQSPGSAALDMDLLLWSRLRTNTPGRFPVMDRGWGDSDFRSALRPTVDSADAQWTACIEIRRCGQLQPRWPALAHKVVWLCLAQSFEAWHFRAGRYRLLHI